MAENTTRDKKRRHDKLEWTIDLNHYFLNKIHVIHKIADLYWQWLSIYDMLTILFLRSCRPCHTILPFIFFHSKRWPIEYLTFYRRLIFVYVLFQQAKLLWTINMWIVPELLQMIILYEISWILQRFLLGKKNQHWKIEPEILSKYSCHPKLMIAAQTPPTEAYLIRNRLGLL